MKTKLTLKIFTLIVVIINITSMLLVDFFYSQIVRLVSSILFFLLFFVFKISDKKMIAFIGLLVIADVFDLYYTQPYIIEIYSFLKMLAFSLLGISLVAKLKFQKLGNDIKLLFILVIAINVLIGYKAIVDASSLLGYTQIVSIQAYWVICILSGALAAKYFFLNDSKRAVYFVGFTFLFIFTDLNGFIANFFDAYFFFFSERVLYFLGFMCLGYYLFFSKEEQVIQ